MKHIRIGIDGGRPKYC